MKNLFTISGRYAATEDVPITPQVGYEYKIKDIIHKNKKNGYINNRKNHK